MLPQLTPSSLELLIFYARFSIHRGPTANSILQQSTHSALVALVVSKWRTSRTYPHASGMRRRVTVQLISALITERVVSDASYAERNRSKWKPPLLPESCHRLTERFIVIVVLFEGVGQVEGLSLFLSDTPQGKLTRNFNVYFLEAKCFASRYWQ